MENYRELAQASWRNRVFHRALVVALVVGTVLNLINQGDALAAGRHLDWMKAVLTYLVPFCVSSHGGLSARRADPASASPPST
jgi:hypothetical protein